jgi:hypothetical protein
MNLGLMAKVRFNELIDFAVLFRELELLARTSSSGRYLNEADRFLNFSRVNAARSRNTDSIVIIDRFINLEDSIECNR